jgi:hypothetical protein
VVADRLAQDVPDREVAADRRIIAALLFGKDLKPVIDERRVDEPGHDAV